MRASIGVSGLSARPVTSGSAARRWPLRVALSAALALPACAAASPSIDDLHPGESTGGSGGGGGTGGYVQPGCEGASRGVFVNDGETLFRFEPSTRIMTRVANFEGCGTSVVDIAVDKHGAMYGITADGFVKIDSATADCTRIRDGVFPNSLSFVPEGTVYPDREALVGYLDQRYVVLDPGTGAMEQRDALPDSFFSAGGDVVSVAEGATYVAAADSSITDALGRSPYSLLRVDPASGKMLANVGRFDANAVFALAYWDGVVYAFTGDGRAVTFEEATGTMKLIHLDGMSLGSRFDGGASTTCSPLAKAP